MTIGTLRSRLERLDCRYQGLAEIRIDGKPVTLTGGQLDGLLHEVARTGKHIVNLTKADTDL